MLHVIIYDIRNAKRLRKVATACEDRGTRVQYSVFECWLDEDAFTHMWEHLATLIDPEEDRIAVYKIDQKSAKKRLALGLEMEITEKKDYFVF